MAGALEGPADQHFSPAARFITAQAWWIASELSRRNSSLQTLESFPLDGFYHGLEVSRPGTGGHVFMNFEGSLHLRPSTGEDQQWPWVLAFRAASPHELVRRIEETMRWSKTAADPTTRRSLMYRTVSFFLNAMVNDREVWTAAQFGHLADVPRESFSGLGTAVALELAQEHQAIFWQIKADGDPRCVLDTRGHLYGPSARADLMPVYRQRGRMTDVFALLADVVLP